MRRLAKADNGVRINENPGNNGLFGVFTCSLWEQEVDGSNPFAPTRLTSICLRAKPNTVEIDISHSHPLPYGLLFCER